MLENFMSVYSGKKKFKKYFNKILCHSDLPKKLIDKTTKKAMKREIKFKNDINKVALDLKLHPF